MKRLLLLVVITLAGQLAWLQQSALAHGGRWGCGSYSSGYSYYYPQYYYPSYNNSSSYYGGYSSYYGNGNVPYSNYGSYPQYNNVGLGLGGGNLLGLLAGNNLSGANLSGSLLQPSYLSMPVGVGYGQAGFLQIPMGSPAGRASYLQIPVNMGYGPSSYLQIELGRNAGSAVPSAPAPSASPTVPPFGALPGTNTATTGQFTYDIPRTPADEVPPAVLPAECGSARTSSIATTEASQTSSVAGKRSTPTAGTDNSRVQFVFWSSAPAVTPVHIQAAPQQLAKDTSFTLGDHEAKGRTLGEGCSGGVLRSYQP